MSEILFEGMRLRSENISKIQRRGNAIYYRNRARVWDFLFGYKDRGDAKFARDYLSKLLLFAWPSNARKRKAKS
jgi:hypothetical protein